MVGYNISGECVCEFFGVVAFAEGWEVGVLGESVDYYPDAVVFFVGEWFLGRWEFDNEVPRYLCPGCFRHRKWLEFAVGFVSSCLGSVAYVAFGDDFLGEFQEVWCFVFASDSVESFCDSLVSSDG